MRVRCEYCHSFIEDTDKVCPQCGAPNAQMMRSANEIPKTIEELQQYIREKNIPVDKLRFFIGENYQGPRAFGIYREDSQNIVVYKNKSDGERVVRYRGSDEAYAVNEIYQKMRIEFQESKARNTGNFAKTAPQGKPKKRFGCLTGLLFMVVLLVIVTALATALLDSGSDGSDYGYSGSGYSSDYHYGGSSYDSYDSGSSYNSDDSWSSYDSDDSWSSYDSDSSWDDSYDTWDDSSWDDDDWDWDSSSDSDWDWGGSDSSWDSDW